ncbi:unnamed protein product [Adineta steineri]|uniref:Bromo domain-containing protein n=2 Tax=Adineta steineri TaxID=433720 RepID=A0A815A9V3_9BILA|nr:unnamed protein product [Adineta steineri]CAF3645001.1 unnamed protein product [Adineta steineri]
MVNTRSSHPNGDTNTNDSYKERHIKKVVNYEQESSNDSFGNSKGPSHYHRILRKRTNPTYQNSFDYMDDDDEEEETIGRRRRRESRRNVRTLVDTSNSGSPTTGRLTNGTRSERNLSMYDRVKARRKSNDPDIYSEDREENDVNEQQEEQNDQNNENDNDTKKSKNKKKEQTIGNGGDDMTEENTMDILNQDEEEEEEEELNNQQTAKYSLRERKPPIQRFSLYEQPRQRRKTIFYDEDDERPSTSRSRRSRQKGRRVSAHVSSSSTSDSSSDSETMGPLTNGDLDSRPQRTARLAKSTAMKRMRCLPTNLDILGVYTSSKKPGTRTSSNGAGSGVGALNLDLNSKSRRGNNAAVSLADAESIEIDRTITFDDIGGLDPIIRSLKEMIVLPLVYPELFHHYKIKPPRGVLFYGPPGTGKTLVARALVNECSSPDRRIAFFMRKGADCLCKYVGESERQLRVLFDQAYQQRPAIIFFDEIDGLAPVRSARQDQIHASIVSTLLALMDGLDNRGEVVVIGATNRLDAIDPALRRPGRFDREFRFSLPTIEARKQILKIHTKEWESKPHTGFIDEIAIRTASFCGADLKSLCQEAFLSALRRRYPQIYDSRQKYKIDPRSLHLSRGDFYTALHRIVPACNRGCQHPVGRPLDMHLIPLLSEQLDKCLEQLHEIFFKRTSSNNNNSNQIPFQSISDDLTTTTTSTLLRKAPTLGLTTSFASSSHRSATFTMRSIPDNGLCRFFASAVVQQLDCAFFVFELGYLHAQTSRTPEEACAQLFTEARRSAPSIIYVPDIENLWPKLSESVQYMFVSNVRTLPPNLPILILIALETDSYDDIHPDISQIISPKSTFTLTVPNADDRYSFFAPLFNEEMFSSVNSADSRAEPVQEILEIAEIPAISRERSEQELERVRQREEATMTELRVFLRDMLKILLRDKRFTYFSRPIDVEDVPDYYDVIENPMTFSMMLEKVDKHGYTCVKQLTQDIDLIVSNALLYNPDHTTQGRLIRHRACELRDVCQFHINAELDMEFELLCQQVTEARKQRGDDPKESLPNYVYTEQTTTADSSTHQENENGSHNGTEHAMDVSAKNPLNTTDQSEAQVDISIISTRNSAKRNKLNHSQRSSTTRRQAKEKELVNGHNEETVLSAEDTETTTITTEISTKTQTTDTNESIIITATTTNQSSQSSSSPSNESSNKKRVKRTVSSISLSPSKLTSTNDTSAEIKTKRQRTDITIQAIESAPANIEQHEHPPRKINIERLTSNLMYLVEHTNNYGVEKLSTLWFELFDIIESCRSLLSEESIFEKFETNLRSII